MSHPADPSTLPTADDATFGDVVLRSDRPVLVEFGGRWCGPCKALAPILASVAAETQGRCRVVTVDVDDSPEAARRFGVRGVPTVVAFANGSPAGKIVGLTSKKALLDLVGTLIA